MSNELSSDHLYDALRHAGVTDRSAAARVVEATLCVLAERLTADEKEVLCRGLVEPLRGLVRSSGYAGDFDGDEMYGRIRRRASLGAATLGAGMAREEAQVVIGTIARHATEEAAHRLARALPAEVAALFEPPNEGEAPPHAAVPGHTLASGRPGSRHPLSGSAPRDAQSHSVAREANPHGETKVSSARGLTQERLGESLAEGKAGGGPRTLSEARDEERR